MEEATEPKLHSRFSASGAERWFFCSSSVALSEGIPSKSSVYSIEGTKGHALVEGLLVDAKEGKKSFTKSALFRSSPFEMQRHAVETAKFILGLREEHPDSDFLVETKISLSFVHKDAFGTFDAGIAEHFGTLHVIDFKYGAGVPVSPVENLQMIFYGLGLAYRYQWNFARVKLWIIQPRIRGYDGPVFWELSMRDLMNYVPKFIEAVRRVEYQPTYKEGSWCFWCPAKSVCPLKQEAKVSKAKMVFLNS